ncbi:MAG: arsenite methyltransferase [Gammaproteobacteria bacterium]
MNRLSSQDLREKVRERYAGIAAEGSGCCGTEPQCCGESGSVSAQYLGYTSQELASLPEGADLGLGCGNPVAIAELKAGERVLDLGSGAGIDAFLAAKQVGPSGRVIGVDMTHEMIARARKNAEAGGYANVEFRLGEIEHLPVADNEIDVILSNCVINLSTDKAAVFREAFRVLKPGGRLRVSDIVALQPLPDALREDVESYTGCASGAALVSEVEAMLEEAGFVEVDVAPRSSSREAIREIAGDRGIEAYIASADITASKPAST